MRCLFTAQSALRLSHPGPRAQEPEAQAVCFAEDGSDDAKRKTITTNDKNDLSTTTTTTSATTLTPPDVTAATAGTALVPTTTAGPTPHSPPTATSSDLTSMNSGLFDLTELLSSESPTTQNFLSCLTGVESPPSLVTSSPTPWYSLHLDNLGSQLFDYFRNPLGATNMCLQPGMQLLFKCVCAHGPAGPGRA